MSPAETQPKLELALTILADAFREAVMMEGRGINTDALQNDLEEAIGILRALSDDVHRSELNEMRVSPHVAGAKRVEPPRAAGGGSS